MPDQEAKIERTTFWFDREIIRLAKKVAALEEGTTATEVMEGELWKALRRRYSKALDRANAEHGGEAG